MTVMTQQISIDAGAERDARIRDEQNAVIDRIRADPSTGRSTLRTEGCIEDGLSCTVTQGDISATLDFGPGMGGDGTGPSPGFFARASIAGCVAIGVKMLAAREGLRFERVDVSVEMDFDDSALFGMGTRHAAPLGTRIGIAITSAEPEAAVRDLVARALEMDPYFLALRDPQQVWAQVTVTPSSQ